MGVGVRLGATALGLLALVGLCWVLAKGQGKFLAQAQGNARCWAGQFTYEFCCNASFPETPGGFGGNPDCWDKRRYTYQRCCLSTDEPLPPLTPVNPRASKKWRVVCGKDVGGWMVHELYFYSDDACTQHVRRHARPIDSGHRRSYPPGHAFDQWVKATDEYFWYSNAAEAGEAWLGVELVRPAEIRCVSLWHNNIPDVPVTLQRWDEPKSLWLDVTHWSAAKGGEWATLKDVGPVDFQDTPKPTVEPTSAETPGVGAVHEL